MAALAAAFPCVLLTGRNSCGILCYDNDSCHLDKKDCQAREVLYDTAKSFEGTQSCTECQSAGNGTPMRRIAADDQPDRAGRLFAVCHPCSDDRKGLRRYGRRNLL